MAQSVLGRIGQLVRANINAILDAAEDPGLMLDQLIRDYDSNIRDVESAVAQTIGNLRLLEDDHREALDASREWAEKARAASRKADELRAGTQTAEAERFDNLTRIALRRQVSYEEQAQTLERQVRQQRELTEKLKTGLDQIRIKREDLVQKRDELVARSKMAGARVQVQQAIKSVSVMDPTSELSRFEDRVRREEAMAGGMEEVAVASIDQQFDQLATGESDLEVERRFAALKAGR